MKYALLLVATILFAAPAAAEDYEKGPNGGQMLDVAGIDAELLASGNTVTINVFEAFKAKPVSTKGYVGAVLIVGGMVRETITLAPQGENSLKGDVRNPIPVGATITLTIKTAEGKSGQVKFKKWAGRREMLLSTFGSRLCDVRAVVEHGGRRRTERADRKDRRARCRDMPAVHGRWGGRSAGA